MGALRGPRARAAHSALQVSLASPKYAQRKLTQAQAPHQLPTPSALGVAAHDEDDGDDLHDARLLLNPLSLRFLHNRNPGLGSAIYTNTTRTHTHISLHHTERSWSLNTQIKIQKTGFHPPSSDTEHQNTKGDQDSTRIMNHWRRLPPPSMNTHCTTPFLSS